MSLRVHYRRIPAGECCACLFRFANIDVAELSCGHMLHPNCIAALETYRCPLRCGQIRAEEIRPQQGGQAAAAIAPGQEWGGEIDRDIIDAYRTMRSDGSIDAYSLALLEVMEAGLVQREAVMRANERKLARAARIQAQRAKVDRSTLALLIECQSVFFEAAANDTFFTNTIEGGITDEALLIRLLFKPDANTIYTYYIWIDTEDKAEDIARAWSGILWGAETAKEDPTDFGPFFMCNNKVLNWVVKLELSTGDTIEHCL